jgi:hypothetical protein
MSQLLPCPTCHRHVEVRETVCPFCAAELPASFRAPPPASSGRRLGRAALMAAGATMLGAAACSTDSISTDAASDRPPISDASGTGGATGSAGATGGDGAVAGNGGQAGHNGAAGRSGAGGSIVAAYGAPVLTGEGGSRTDGGQDRNVVSIYGAAFPDRPDDSSKTTK